MAFWSKMKFVSDGQSFCLYVIGHVSVVEVISMRRKYIGHPLVALLAQSLNQQGQSVSKLAAEVGISQSYMSELLVGDKQFSKINDDVVRSIAAYLKIPAVVALLMAGKLRHQDFVDRPLELDEM